MQAIRCEAHGEPESLVLTEVPAPPLEAGSVRLRVRAAGANFADLLMLQGKYQDQPPLPFTPGVEGAGEVIEVAPDVEGWQPGDRAFALLSSGGYAEEAVVPARDLVRMRSPLDFAEAAGFGIAYATSHVGLRHLARTEAGETVLVHGAAGGVGLTAVEVAHALGARVIAVARGADRLEVVREHGADDTIDSAGLDQEQLRDRIVGLTGERGVDVVYDPVGGDAFRASLSAAAWGARILLVGFASGDVPQIPANHLLVKNVSAIGFTIGTYREHAPEVLRASFDELFAWHAEGRIRPFVSDRLPLARAAEALRRLADRHVTGKLVLEP